MNQTIGVNITPQSFQPTLHFSQGDVGRVFVVNVTDYDIPSSATVTCVATKPSGMGFTVSGTVSGNSVTFTSTAEMTDEWGRFPAEIRIASGDVLLGTANFLMIGEKDPHPASTIDGTQEELIPQLTLLVNRVEAAAESVHDLTVSATTLAAGSDATATYDSTNNSIAFGIPRGADGDVTRSEFNDLKSDLTDLYNASIEIGSMIVGKYIESSDGVAYNGANYDASDYIAVKSGYTIKLKNIALTGGTSVCGYSASKTFVTALLTASTGNVDFIVPTDVAYIRLTTYTGQTATGTYTDGVIKKELSIIAHDMYSYEILLPQPQASRYVNTDGTLDVSSVSAAYYHVPVIKNQDVILDGVYLSGNRSIVAYDEDGNITLIASNTSRKHIEFNTANNVKVSFTTEENASPSFYYKNNPTGMPSDYSQLSQTNELIGNYKDTIIDIGRFANGYINENGDFVSSNTYRATLKFEVRYGETIELKNTYSAAYCHCHFYDKNGDHIKAIDAESVAAVPLCEVTVPLNAKYMRFTVLVPQMNTAGASYKTKNERNSVEINTVRQFIVKANKSELVPFQKATHKPIITIIDDDTSSSSAVTRFYNKTSGLGIVGTFACLTSQFNNDVALATTLKSFERDGFQTVLHGYTQGDFYNYGTSRNIADAMDDLVHGMEDLQANNFIDWKFWVTPFGVWDVSMQNLARKLGLKCLVNTGSSVINSDDGTFGRYEIQRASLNESSSIATIEGLIDECVEENGWLLFCTHAAEWQTPFENFDTIVNYALSKGCEFKTLGDAFRIREPIYNFYDLF